MNKKVNANLLTKNGCLTTSAREAMNGYVSSKIAELGFEEIKPNNFEITFEGADGSIGYTHIEVRSSHKPLSTFEKPKKKEKEIVTIED